MAPQGYLASGNAYTRRYDKIIIDIPRKTKCVNVLWGEELVDNWWFMIDYLELMGKMELYLIQKKSSLHKNRLTLLDITVLEIKPQEKSIKAIKKFPTPKTMCNPGLV